MPSTIWKFPLEVTDLQRIPLPMWNKKLCAQFQGDILCLWAIVDPTSPMQEERIWIFGTGQPIPVDFFTSARQYFGTVQRDGLVWHVFGEAETAFGL